MEVTAVAKDRPKGRSKASAKPNDTYSPSGPSRPSGPEVLPHDKKVLDAFLREVEENLWGISDEDKARALKDLKDHVLERYRPRSVDHAMDVAIATVGSPEVLAKGVRTLYGFSTGFKSFLVALAFVFGISTIPMVGTLTLLGPWPVLGLLVTFMFISSMGTQVGLKWGAAMGLAAATSRIVALLVLLFGQPDEYTLGTSSALFDFILVSMFLLLVGALAGHIRETSVKDYFENEAF